MKKLLLILVLFSSAFAAQNGSYIGVGVGYSSVEAESLNGDNGKSDGVSGALALGYKYNENGRIYAVGTYKDASNGYESLNALSLAYDFMVPLHEMLSLYVGFVGGYSNYTSNDIADGGAHYGAEAGAVLSLSKTVEVEVGYRYLKEDTDKITLNAPLYTAKNSQMATVEFNFYFDSEKYFTYGN